MADKKVVDIITREALGPDDPRLKRRKAEIFAFPVREKEIIICNGCMKELIAGEICLDCKPDETGEGG